MASVLSRPQPSPPQPGSPSPSWGPSGGRSPSGGPARPGSPPAAPSRLHDRLSRPGWRWAGRALLALPLMALAAWAHHRGFSSPSLQFLEHRAHRTIQGGLRLHGLRFAYPPLPVLLAVILPYGRFGLAIVTCLFSGAMLLHTADGLLRRVPLSGTAVLLLPLVAVPAMWYIAAEQLPAVMALTFLAVALEGYIRFAAYGETDGGFIAGMALALSYCADPGALLYAAAMALFAPLICHLRYKDDPMATVSIGAVLLFPIAAVTLGWAFLVWKFSGTFSRVRSYALGEHVLVFPGGVAHALAHAASSAMADLAHVPLFLAVALVFSVRRPAAGIGLLLPVLALIFARFVGFAYTPVTAYFLLTLLALTVIGHALPPGERRLRWVLIGAALAQLALAFAWPQTATESVQWLHTIFGGLG